LVNAPVNLTVPSLSASSLAVFFLRGHWLYLHVSESEKEQTEDGCSTHKKINFTKACVKKTKENVCVIEVL